MLLDYVNSGSAVSQGLGKRLDVHETCAARNKNVVCIRQRFELGAPREDRRSFEEFRSKREPWIQDGRVPSVCNRSQSCMRFRRQVGWTHVGTQQGRGFRGRGSGQRA